MPKMNEDVPIEAVVKWLARERDTLRDKLEQLTGYAKAMETRIMEIEARLHIRNH